ncbi:hypothetical protein JG688_00017197 [Phytophthora aleatoria]|uniref:Peptidase S74 domain-containing protein n=1 Tax=Phytophthora aleatoria TaxID=2496075 RepID=A0A8J5M1H7_9STRA|nr:hypothetical protein JG688_00017197 [Phytophthora aleatoria]
MTFDSAGTGINTPALSFGGTVFNQNYYISITEGSADISKALINNTASSSSSTTGALRCLGGGYFGGDSLFSLAITCTDLYGSILTSTQPYITSLGTLSGLSTTGAITCGGNLNGFLSYGKLTELGIGTTAATAEYVRITGSGSDYLDGSYTRMMRCVGSNTTPIEFQIEVGNGTNATSTNAAWIGTRTNNDLRFGVNDSTAMTLSAAGRLGLGTTTPNVPLHIPGFTSISYGNGSTMVYRLRTNNGVTEMALGPILYDTTAVFGGYISCAALATTSDGRLKQNIQSAPLDRIKILYDKCNVVIYEWIPSEKRQGQEVGFIAQDLVRAGLTDLVSVFHRDGMPVGEDANISPKDVQLNVDYSRIAAYNMKMIQHLMAEIEELKKENKSFSSDGKCLHRSLLFLRRFVSPYASTCRLCRSVRRLHSFIKIGSPYGCLSLLKSLMDDQILHDGFELRDVEIATVTISPT